MRHTAWRVTLHFALLTCVLVPLLTYAERRGVIVSTSKAQKNIVDSEERIDFSRELGSRFSVPIPEEMFKRDNKEEIVFVLYRNGVDLAAVKQAYEDFVKRDPIITQWSASRSGRKRDSDKQNLILLKGERPRDGRKTLFAVNPKGQVLSYTLGTDGGIRYKEVAKKLERTPLNLGSDFYKALAKAKVSRLPLFSDEGSQFATFMEIPEALPFAVNIDEKNKLANFEVVNEIHGDEPFELVVGVTRSLKNPNRPVPNILGVRVKLRPAEAKKPEGQKPGEKPGSKPSTKPSAKPSLTATPTPQPTKTPAQSPTQSPTQVPTQNPTQEPTPTVKPSSAPTAQPSVLPTVTPTAKPSATPTPTPTATPTPQPTSTPTPPLAPPSSGNTITAISCSQSDVQTAINLAQDGQTVLVPAGTCRWSPPGSGGAAVRISNKSIVLKGAGIDQTNIVLENASSNNHVALSVSMSTDKPFRITGFTFSGDGKLAYVSISGISKSFRIDHISNKVDSSQPTRLLMVTGHTHGVIDNVQTQSNQTGGTGMILVRADDNTARLTGNTAWKRPLNMGSSEAVYIEDSIFNGAAKNFTGFATDVENGGRLVFRHNHVTNLEFGSHGAQTSGGRGAMQWEVYNNTFTLSHSVYSVMVWLRGGTGVVFNNLFARNGGYGHYIGIDNPRSHTAYKTFGSICNGTNQWDGNKDTTGYPCLDQIGTGPGDPGHQTLAPAYFWNNKDTSTDTEVKVSVINSSGVHIKKDRDYYEGVSRPGYLPYIYPHPLRAQGFTADTPNNKPPVPSPTTPPTLPPPPPSSGNTIHAASCSQTHVQAAINQAQDGDTVIIPAGTCTWANRISLSKGIHLTGASKGAVTLVANPGNMPLLSVTENPSRSIEISNIRFTTVNNASRENWGGLYLDVGMASNGKPVLFHDNYIDVKVRRGIRWSPNRGVIYNNEFEDSGQTPSTASANGNPIQFVNNSLTSSWTTPDTMGMRDTTGTNNVYVEDNTFTRVYLTSMDADSNSRTVVRYNTFDNSGTGSHGADTSPFGVRHWELYNNTFSFDRLDGGCNNTNIPNMNWYFFIRGGTGVIADNIMPDIQSCAWGNKAEIVMTVMNLRRNSGPYPCWKTYPAPRQVGQSHDGTKYITDPVYIWGNTGDPKVGVSDYTPNECGSDALLNSQFVQAGRDYIVGTAKPGYQKYTYPHPLRG